MFKKFLVSNILLVTLVPHMQAQFLQPPCTIPAQIPVSPKNPAIVVTTAPGVDTGYVISRAVSQALSSGSNTVIVNSGGRAPMTTPVILNNLSNFTIQMNPGVQIFGYDMAGAMFVVNGGHNVKITGGNLFAGDTGVNGPSCISVVGQDGLLVDGIELSGMECSGTTSHGIGVAGYGSTASSYANVQNVSIHNTFVHDTGSLNLFATGVRNLCMQSNILVNPANAGVEGNGDPSNVGVAFSENVYFGSNYVSGTPTFFREPNPQNTPPSGFYAYSSMNVNTDSNIFTNSKCTLALCSGTGDLPSSPSAIHDDTVLNAINIANVVDSYGPGITCELSWFCGATGGYIHDVYSYGLYDESNASEVSVNLLTSTAGLSAGDPSVTLQSMPDVVNGVSTSVVQATVPGTYVIFSQNLGAVAKYGVEPFPEIWVKSAAGQPADGLELWFSADSNIWNVHSKVALPALAAGQWTRVALAPSHLTLMGLVGVQTWGIVNPGNHNPDTIRVSDYRQIADSRNNVYTGVNIARTGAYPLDVSGCGRNTTFVNNTITDPGTTGIWPYTNTGLMGQVFMGGYPNCVRSGVYFNSNVVNMNSSAIPRAGGSLFNLSNYGANNAITGVVLDNDTAVGPYAPVPNVYLINNQGPNSTIDTPTIINH